jgi:hypothetical protein
MATNFKYPDKPMSVSHEDWNHQLNDDSEEHTEEHLRPNANPGLEEIKKQQSLEKLVNFIKTQLLSDPKKEMDPKKQLRKKAISAYKKNIF